MLLYSSFCSSGGLADSFFLCRKKTNAKGRFGKKNSKRTSLENSPTGFVFSSIRLGWLCPSFLWLLDQSTVLGWKSHGCQIVHANMLHILSVSRQQYGQFSSSGKHGKHVKLWLKMTPTPSLSKIQRKSRVNQLHFNPLGGS